MPAGNTILLRERRPATTAPEGALARGVARRGHSAPLAHGVTALIPFHVGPPAPDLLEGVLRHVDDVVLVDDRPRPDADVVVHEPGRIGLVRVPGPRHGKGHALAWGLRALGARGRPPSAVMLLDADGQHPPEAIPSFLGPVLADRADLVIGDRVGRRGAMPLERRAANRAARGLMALTTGVAMGDTQCGMRMLGPRALRVPFPGGGFEAETRHLRRCLSGGLRVRWVPIPAIYRGEPSAFRRLRDSTRVVGAILG